MITTRPAQGLRAGPIITDEQKREIQAYAREVAESLTKKHDQEIKVYDAILLWAKNQEPAPPPPKERSAAKYIAGGAIIGAAAAVIKGK